jgi:cytochrome c oxidase subunit 4
MSTAQPPTNAQTRVEEQEHHGLGHVVPLKLLVGVFLSLLFLTYLTVQVSYWNLGNMSLYVALGVAVVKAALVVLFFMHLFWDRGFNMVVFLSCILFVGLFIGLTLTDVSANRPDINWVESQQVLDAQKTAHEKAPSAPATTRPVPAGH